MKLRLRYKKLKQELEWMGRKYVNQYIISTTVKPVTYQVNYICGEAEYNAYKNRPDILMGNLAHKFHQAIEENMFITVENYGPGAKINAKIMMVPMNEVEQ